MFISTDLAKRVFAQNKEHNGMIPDIVIAKQWKKEQVSRCCTADVCLHQSVNQLFYSIVLCMLSPLYFMYTGRMGWMAHLKWKETKQQPSKLPGPAVPGSCLAYFHFRWAIHPIRPVDIFEI